MSKGNVKVTVILPVRNGAKYIRDAIDSVLNQTFDEFELMVLDDESTDETVAVVDSYDDERIHLISMREVRRQSSGEQVQQRDEFRLARLLNYGMTLGTGKYIARMDADDVCKPDRFEKQFSFLEQHPDVTFCGVFGYVLGTGRLLTSPVEHEDIRASLLFYNVILHSGVFIRRDDWCRHKFAYPTEYPHAEDYGLWVEMIEKVRFHILPEPLVYYRMHDGQVSNHNRGIQFAAGTKLQAQILTRLGIEFTEEELQVHTHCRSLVGNWRLRKWCDKVLTRNLEVGVYDQGSLERIVNPLMTLPESR